MVWCLVALEYSDVSKEQTVKPNYWVNWDHMGTIKFKPMEVFENGLKMLERDLNPQHYKGSFDQFPFSPETA